MFKLYISKIYQILLYLDNQKYLKIKPVPLFPSIKIKQLSDSSQEPFTSITSTHLKILSSSKHAAFTPLLSLTYSGAKKDISSNPSVETISSIQICSKTQTNQELSLHLKDQMEFSGLTVENLIGKPFKYLIIDFTQSTKYQM